MSTLYRASSSLASVCRALAAPVPSVETRATPMSSAVLVAATRRGFFWMLAVAMVDAGPIWATSAPTPLSRSGTHRLAHSSRPRKKIITPPIAMSSTRENCSLLSADSPCACRQVSTTVNAVTAAPNSIISRLTTSRAAPDFLAALTSSGCSASSGVTVVAVRADPSEARIVTTTPKAIGTRNTCGVSTVTKLMPENSTPATCSSCISPMDRPTATSEEISPSSSASATTERYSCPFLAPMVRSSASVRRRCATSTWKVLAMTSAATNMASTPKTIMNVVIMLVCPPPSRLSTWSSLVPRSCAAKCAGSRALTCLMTCSASVPAGGWMSRYRIVQFSDA